jgi:hypothetical protein
MIVCGGVNGGACMLESLFQRVTGGPLGTIAQPEKPPNDVFDVHDGDGIKWHGISCRIEGYDAPEIYRPRSKVNPELEWVRGYKALGRLREWSETRRS